MAESTQLIFTHKEVVEALIEKHGISTGIWGLYIKFGIGAANMAPQTAPAELHPTAIVPVLEIGLQKFDQEGNLSVDAASLKGKARPRKKAK